MSEGDKRVGMNVRVRDANLVLNYRHEGVFRAKPRSSIQKLRHHLETLNSTHLSSPSTTSIITFDGRKEDPSIHRSKSKRLSIQSRNCL